LIVHLRREQRYGLPDNDCGSHFPLPGPTLTARIGGEL
jgi:GMP synthase PP-ATPase subunit